MNPRDSAELLYTTHFASLNLAPKHIAAIKEVMAQALKKKEKPRAAARAWLKAHGLAAAEPAVAATSTRPPIDYQKLDLKHLDRKSLRATILELHAAGVKVKGVTVVEGEPQIKKLEDHELLRAVSETVNNLPSPQTLEALDALDPRKLETVLKQDCIGVFVDLRTPACQACPDKGACTRQFLTNLKGNFSVFKDAHAEIKTEETAAQVTDKEIAMKTKKSDKAKTARTPYDPKLVVFVMSIKNPQPKSDPSYTLLKEILALADKADFAPCTLKEIYAVVAKHLGDTYSKTDFMEELFPQFLEEGVIKRREDLTKDERRAYDAALKEANEE